MISELHGGNAPEQFREAIRNAGLNAPDVIVDDGKLHRFATNGSQHDDAGWYVFHSDGIPAGSFGDWRTGVSKTWRAGADRMLTQAEEAAYRAKIEAMRQAREEDEARRQADAATRAKEIWDTAQPDSGEHPYLERKGVKSHGLRVYRGDLVIGGLPCDGCLIVPMNLREVLQSLQFIAPNGDKRFLSGGRVKGCYYSIGTTKDIKQQCVLCIAEGYATAASIREATGYVVVAAFNAGNLPPVALTMARLRNQYPEARLIVCADDDAGTEGNPGITKAMEAAKAIGGLLALPNFGDNRPEGATDFNDLTRSQGDEAIRRCLEAATPAPTPAIPTVSDLSVADSEQKCKHKDAGPWSKAQTAKDFLSTVDQDLPMLYPSLLARGSITECFSPRGIGKTHAGHWLAVTLAKEGKRVLLLDRDNSRREVKRRLRAWGAEGLIDLKVLTRDEVPPLTEAEKWRAFPFQDYDVVLIDSLESSTEGCGEQDSAKPSRAIAPLLDIAHRENGPAILILGNTIKSGAHSRGSGVVEDRADVAFEVRDATDVKPSGTKDWWFELPAAGAEEWANRASRRTRRDTYRLAFIASKYRIGEEPDPFIWEITMPDTGEPWTLQDVTADVVKAGTDAKKSADTEHRATLDQAAIALADQIRQQVDAGDPMLSDKDAIPYLMRDHGLTRKDARRLIKDEGGVLWDRIQGNGKGHPQILVPVGYQTRSAAEKHNEERSLLTSSQSVPIAAECMDTGWRKSGQTETTSSAVKTVSLFPPPDQVMPPKDSDWEEVADEC